jgi:hypothetical protein
MKSENYGTRYYAVNGRPMTMMEWSSSFSHYRHIGLDILRIRGHHYRVSTVWLGLDHSFFGGPPLIFETMVFEDEDMSGLDLMDRYSTLSQAKRGHIRMVRAVKRIVRSRKTKQLFHNGRKPTAIGRSTAEKLRTASMSAS